MKFELRELLLKLVEEFNLNKANFFSNSKLIHALRLCNYPAKGCLRTNKSFKTISWITYDFNILRQMIGREIMDYQSVQQIYNFISENNLWHENLLGFEPDKNIMPSVSTKVAGGFLARNFQLNNYEFVINDISFTQSLKELYLFFSKDYIESYTYINLWGLSGDIVDFRLNNDISLVKGSYPLVKEYNLAYSFPNNGPCENLLYEDDYFLKFRLKIPKIDFRRSYSTERELVKKLELFALLSFTGYLELGKYLRQSKDWPEISITAMGPYNRFLSENNFTKTNSSVFNEKSIAKLKSAFEIVIEADLSKLDKKIHYAIERLTKAKAAKNIDDKVVELAIAFEYLINSDNHIGNITMQLCLKAIKIAYAENQDPSLYVNLKKFYAFRSKIVHGTSKINLDSDTLKVIEIAEDVVQKIILKFIKLGKVYNFKTIEKAAMESLHLSKSFEEILSSSN